MHIKCMFELNEARRACERACSLCSSGSWGTDMRQVLERRVGGCWVPVQPGCGGGTAAAHKWAAATDDAANDARMSGEFGSGACSEIGAVVCTLHFHVCAHVCVHVVPYSTRPKRRRVCYARGISKHIKCSLTTSKTNTSTIHIRTQTHTLKHP